MQINQKDYKILRQDVPVLTKQNNGLYVNTNCYLSDFNISSNSIEQI